MKAAASSALVLVGIALGCTVSAIAPDGVEGTAQAEGAPGQWDCAGVGRMPNIDSARNFVPAKNVEGGLNQLAAHVPAGEILVVDGGNGQVVCTKR